MSGEITRMTLKMVILTGCFLVLLGLDHPVTVEAQLTLTQIQDLVTLHNQDRGSVSPQASDMTTVVRPAPLVLPSSPT